MSGNRILNSAAKNKNDEFYTLYDDIQKELNCYLDYDENVFKDKTILLPCDDPEWSNFTKFFAANFERYKIKKLISTSYATNSKKLISVRKFLCLKWKVRTSTKKLPIHAEKFLSSTKIITAAKNFISTIWNGVILKATAIFAASKSKNFLPKPTLSLPIRRSVCFANF